MVKQLTASFSLRQLMPIAVCALGLASAGSDELRSPALIPQIDAPATADQSTPSVGSPTLDVAIGECMELPQALVSVLGPVRQLSDRVFCGGEPRSDRGFQALVDLGVQTLVSVDGARPDVETAKSFGLRYVHIPFGYDGIPLSAQHQLTRVMRESSGRVYFHCHHGHHRGPAAAAVACRVENSTSIQGAIQILTDAGTSRDYTGLWHDVEHFRVPDPETQLPELTETAPITPLAATMANASRHWEVILKAQEEGWPDAIDRHTPKDPNSLLPSAVLLQELLHEALRNDTESYDAEFRKLLAQSDQLASDLTTAVRNQDWNAASEQISRLKLRCAGCHHTYRD